MFKIPVHRRTGDNVSSECEWLNVGDIDLIKAERAKDKKSTISVIYSKGYEFLPGIKIDALTNLLSETEGFVRVDRGRLINLKNNPQMDKKRGIIYFNNNMDIYVVLAPKYSKDVLKYF